jgi:hypothetical protein
MEHGVEPGSCQANRAIDALVSTFGKSSEACRDKRLPQRAKRFRGSFGGTNLSNLGKEIFLEVFWGLFHEGVIAPGMNDSNDMAKLEPQTLGFLVLCYVRSPSA